MPTTANLCVAPHLSILSMVTKNDKRTENKIIELLIKQLRSEPFTLTSSLFIANFMLVPFALIDRKAIFDQI